MAKTLPKPTKLKSAIYIRVSTQWQVDRDSIKIQRKDLIAYSKLVLNIHDYEVFEDSGYSAKNTDRPAYQEMIQRLRTGEFSHLLVWKIDRISRNLLDFTSMYAELKTLGVTFVSKNEQFDTSSAIGEAMLKIILIFAELERKMTAERVTSVMLSRANNGQWNGGKVPYGYTYDKNAEAFTINEKEAEVYEKIASLYEAQHSLLNVSRALNAAGYRTRRGNEWSSTTIYKLLSNRFYIGEYIYNVRTGPKQSIINDKSEWITVKDHHPALITEQRFTRINSILAKNRRGGVKFGASFARKNIHIFAGLCKCAMCGKAMSATKDRIRADGWKPSIYACLERRSSSKCTNKYVSDVTLGPFILTIIENILRMTRDKRKNPFANFQNELLRGEALSQVKAISSDSLAALLDLLTSESEQYEFKPMNILAISGNRDGDLGFLKDQKQKLDNAIHRLTAAYLYAEGGMSEKDYIIERKKLTDKSIHLEEQITKLSANMSQESETDFMQKASYFVLVDLLSGSRKMNYGEYIRKSDPIPLKMFLEETIDHITLLDGRPQSILFKNGLELKFIY